MFGTHHISIAIKDKTRRLDGVYIGVAEIFKGEHSGAVPIKHRLQSFWVRVLPQKGFLERLGHVLEGRMLQTFKEAGLHTFTFISGRGQDQFVHHL